MAPGSFAGLAKKTGGAKCPARFVVLEESNDATNAKNMFGPGFADAESRCRPRG